MITKLARYELPLARCEFLVDVVSGPRLVKKVFLVSERPGLFLYFSFERTEQVYIGSAKTHSPRVKQEMVNAMRLRKLSHGTLVLYCRLKRNVFVIGKDR